MMEVRELNSKKDMLEQLEVLQELYPNLTHGYYDEMLTSMIPCNYGQVAVFDGEECIGISGYWQGTKIWCGKYIELDNVVVKKSARGTGAGKLMQEYLQAKAEETNCNIMVLDAYSHNFKAHRFYYNQGYAPRGFHFIKFIDEEGLT